MRAFLLVALGCLVAAGPAGGQTNDARVTTTGEDNHVATCQMLIVGDAVFILGMEDGLGLATLAAEEPPRLFLGIPDFQDAPATCEIVVDRLDVRGLRGSYVSGPELVGSAPDWSETWAIHVSLTGTGSVAVCQHLALLDVVLLGGTAFGLPPGQTRELLEIRTSEAAGDTSRCKTRIGEFLA